MEWNRSNMYQTPILRPDMVGHYPIHYIIPSSQQTSGKCQPIFTDETLSFRRGSGNKGWPIFQNRLALKAHTHFHKAVLTESCLFLLRLMGALRLNMSKFNPNNYPGRKWESCQGLPLNMYRFYLGGFRENSNKSSKTIITMLFKLFQSIRREFRNYFLQNH